ncbi:hypothetical protein C7964_102420 [Loktanella sp. PT4BL]|jgi:hypothetical protein|nr:hypothetical protein C7964_102420 [Loktanella sp. PT4BL]
MSASVVIAKDFGFLDAAFGMQNAKTRLALSDGQRLFASWTNISDRPAQRCGAVGHMYAAHDIAVDLTELKPDQHMIANVGTWLRLLATALPQSPIRPF